VSRTGEVPEEKADRQRAIHRALGVLQKECGGSIPIDRFMQAALYHPEFGYYTTQVRTLGRGGDFSTWPLLHASLARSVARWLRGAPSRHIIEVGAGTGQLAAGVLARLGLLRRLRTTLHIVEISPILRAAQQKILAGRRVLWHPDLPSALAAAGGCANIYSNELPDAFPCRVFVRTGSRWKELALQIDGNSAREILREADLPASSALTDSAPDGARVEVHDSYRTWLESWAADWRRGEILTIDYGKPMPALTHRRPSGSLRAYAHHQRLTGADVYAGIGHRDLTADVNFTDLKAWGSGLGWQTLSLGTLTDFLSSRDFALPPAFASAGEEFQVLRQRR